MHRGRPARADRALDPEILAQGAVPRRRKDGACRRSASERCEAASHRLMRSALQGSLNA
jgi:hypothetical protein